MITTSLAVDVEFQRNGGMERFKEAGNMGGITTPFLVRSSVLVAAA
jgi:hypothetical protein